MTIKDAIACFGHGASWVVSSGHSRYYAFPETMRRVGGASAYHIKLWEEQKMKQKMLIAGWEVDVASRTAERDGSTANLSPRAIRLLRVLAENPGTTLSRSELLDRVWPNVFVGDDSLSQAVAELRRKLGDRGLIATIPRGGYRLTVPVETFGQAGKGTSASGATQFSIDAYTLCIEAVECFSSFVEGAERTAVDLTKQAVTAAPDCADARAHHAFFLFKRHLQWSEGANLLETAFDEVEAALELDPNNALARMVGAWLSLFGGLPRFGWDDVAMALASSPNCASLHMEASALLLSQERRRAATALAIKAAKLDSDRIEAGLLAARLLTRSDPILARRHAVRALGKVREELSIDPHSVLALYALGPLLAQLGETKAARSALESLAHRDTPLEYFRALGFAQIGDESSALERLDVLASQGWRLGCFPRNDDGFRPLYGNRRFAELQAEIAA